MKIFVGSCIWREVAAEHHKALIPLLRQPGIQYGPQVGDALIERARGISATYFLRQTDADIHLSIDSDIVGFTVEDTLKLCELAEEYGIVGGAYVCRSASRTFPASYYEAGVRVEHAFDHTPVRVKWCATGFLAVHRRVFEALAEGLTLLHASQPWAFYNFYAPFEYQDEDTGEPILLSEDYAFCQRAKEAGFDCYIDPAVRLGHLCSYFYMIEDTAQPSLDPQPLALTRTEANRWRVESIDLAGTKTAMHLPRSDRRKMAASNRKVFANA